MLSAESNFWSVSSVLKPDHFSKEVHGKVYAAIRDLLNEGKKLSLALVESKIGEEYEDGQSTMILMTAYLRDTEDVTDWSSEVEDVVDLWKRRRTIEEVTRTQKLLSDPAKHITDIIAEHEARLDEITQNSQTEPLMSIGQVMRTALEQSVRAHDDGKAPGVTTGLTSLDEILGRIHPGDLGFIGADPGIGKTILAQQIAWHIAASQRQGVIFFQLEMSKADMGRRQLAGFAGMSTAAVEEGMYQFDELERLREAVERADGVPLYIDGGQELYVEQIIDRAAHLKRTKGLSVAFIDHVLKIEAHGNHKDYFAKTKYVTGKLKNAAKRLDIAFICLAHRTLTTQRASYIPKISDLDGGSSLSRDADWIIAMAREEVWLDANRPEDPESSEFRKWAERRRNCKDTVEIFNLKGRRTGRGNKRVFGFDGKLSKIYELER